MTRGTCPPPALLLALVLPRAGFSTARCLSKSLALYASSAPWPALQLVTTLHPLVVVSIVLGLQIGSRASPLLWSKLIAYICR